jgi:hypothetical protein
LELKEDNKMIKKTEKKWTLKEVKARIAGLDEVTQKSVVCALVGHSNIITGCLGYWNCGRCDAQIGDSLGGSFQPVNQVIIGHDCKTCRANAKKLTWKDTFLAPDPFKTAE